MVGLEQDCFAERISPWEIPAVDAPLWLTPVLMFPGTRRLQKLGESLADEGKPFSQMVELTLSEIDR